MSPEADDAEANDAESFWDDSDATQDNLQSAFGAHELPGIC